MFWIILPIYIVGMGAAFVLLGNKYSPEDYWETPGPFFGSFVWPIFLPMLVGGGIGKAIIGNGSKQTKTEKRREAEIEEAEHNLRVAEIRAKENAILERALRS